MANTIWTKKFCFSSVQAIYDREFAKIKMWPENVGGVKQLSETQINFAWSLSN